MTKNIIDRIYDRRHLVWVVFWLGLFMVNSVYADNTITYCVDSGTVAINDTFQVCGTSPVLNPGSSNCQNYTRHMEEVCAAGCDTISNNCTPLPMNRMFILVGVFIIVLLFIVFLTRRYG